MHHDYWAHGPQLESSSATTERLCMTQRYGVPQPRLEAAKNKFINKKYLSFPMSEWKHGAVLVSACLMHLGSASGWLSRSAEFGWAYIWGGQVAVCWSRPASSGDWTLFPVVSHPPGWFSQWLSRVPRKSRNCKDSWGQCWEQVQHHFPGFHQSEKSQGQNMWNKLTVQRTWVQAGH